MEMIGCYDKGTDTFLCSECWAFVKRDAVSNCTGKITLKFCPNCGRHIMDRHPKRANGQSANKEEAKDDRLS